WRRMSIAVCCWPFASRPTPETSRFWSGSSRLMSPLKAAADGGAVTVPGAALSEETKRTNESLERTGIAMKIVIVGGTGLIGSKVVALLEGRGHTAVAAAPNTGVNTLTGEGLEAVMDGTSAVVDVSNSPSWEDDAVMEFFQTSTRN